MKLKVKKLAMLFLCIMAFSLLVMGNPNIERKKPELITIEDIVTDTISQRDSIVTQLIDEVDRYIKKQSPNANKTIAESIVKHGLNYDIDICFIMSQTQIETNFGVAGVGRESSRRSLFGVIKKKYSSYDEAIEAYSKLLRKSYLVKGRTEHDLMKNYVTGGGYRYASATDYEVKLSKAYRIIVNRTNIEELQKQLENV